METRPGKRRVRRLLRRVADVRVVLLALALVVGIRYTTGPEVAPRPAGSTAKKSGTALTGTGLTGTGIRPGAKVPKSPELAKAAEQLEKRHVERRAARAAGAPAPGNPRFTGRELLDGLFGVGPLRSLFGHERELAPAAQAEFDTFLRDSLYPAIDRLAPELYEVAEVGLQSGDPVQVEATLKDVAGVLVLVYEDLTGGSLARDLGNGVTIGSDNVVVAWFFGVWVFVVGIGWLILEVTVLIFLEVAFWYAGNDRPTGSHDAAVKSALAHCKQCQVSPRESELIRDQTLARIATTLAAE